LPARSKLGNRSPFESAEKTPQINGLPRPVTPLILWHIACRNNWTIVSHVYGAL
jgi:hypothetical protein